jgi:hypothetical protein
MDVRRNLELYLAKPHSELDDALGTTKWREAIKKELRKNPPSEECRGATKIVMNIFKEQLGKLKYPLAMSGDDIRFKNRKRADLYKLVFASRDPKGHEFWQKIQIIEASGQRKMTF